MKLFGLLFCLVLMSCSSGMTNSNSTSSSSASSSSTTRVATRTIYYTLKGIPVDLEKAVRAKFEARVNAQNCISPEDLGTQWDKKICARFVPHMNESPITWNKDPAKKDMLLWINVSRVKDTLRYKLKYECSDGDKLVGCFNPGKFEFKRNKNIDDAQAIVDRMFSSPVILGVK